jgi:predicted ATPase
MFALLQALNFRCLHYIRQPLGMFHVLVGPNASGKTTFLDIIAFLSDFVSDGLDKAIEKRGSNLQDIFWKHAGASFGLAVEAQLPPNRRSRANGDEYSHFRYEVAIGIDPHTHENSILSEVGLLKQQAPEPATRSAHLLFPDIRLAPETIHEPARQSNTRTVFSKKPGQHDNYYSETYGASGKGWMPAFKLGPRRSTLANLPEDESRFPGATWFKDLLARGVQQIVLNSVLMRRPSPPGQIQGFKPDGSNLPWVIHYLRQKSGERFGEWIAHVRTALPDIETVETIERPEDKHRYLEIHYAGGIRVPSWLASDGTLRLLALTLPAYLPDFSGVYLIEEPENGIHPRAVETVFQSLSSVYGAQILLATHSPVILSIVDISNVLCFAKTADGATDIVAGNEHPRLRDWRHEVSLGVLFAGGVLD